MPKWPSCKLGPGGLAHALLRFRRSNAASGRGRAHGRLPDARCVLQDAPGSHRGAETGVDVDHRDSGGRGVERSEHGRHAAEGGAIAWVGGVGWGEVGDGRGGWG